MPTARHLLVASLSLLAAGAAAQTHYAWVGTYNPNGEGLYRFTVDPSTGALGDKTLVSQLPNAAQLAVSHDGKTLYLASEVEQGVVQALRVGDNGELSELNQVASGGAGPVYLVCSAVGGVYFVYRAWQLSRSVNRSTAIASFLASIVQLSAVLVGASVDALLRQ